MFKKCKRKRDVWENRQAILSSALALVTPGMKDYFTVTDFARLRGLSGSRPLATAE
jgi:hypothetical protein